MGVFKLIKKKRLVELFPFKLNRSQHETKTKGESGTGEEAAEVVHDSDRRRSLGRAGGGCRDSARHPLEVIEKYGRIVIRITRVPNHEFERNHFAVFHGRLGGEPAGCAASARRTPAAVFTHTEKARSLEFGGAARTR